MVSPTVRWPSRINTCSLFVENDLEKEVSKKKSSNSLDISPQLWPIISEHCRLSSFQFLKLHLFRRQKCVGINDIIDSQKKIDLYVYYVGTGHTLKNQTSVSTMLLHCCKEIDHHHLILSFDDSMQSMSERRSKERCSRTAFINA